MVQRASGSHRYWKFTPDPVLTVFKHHTPSKIESMRKSLLDARPPEGVGLTHEQRGKLHPALRDRLPIDSRRYDFERVAKSLEHARDLSAAELHGPSFYPAVIDTGEPISNWQLRSPYQVRTFLQIPGEESRLFMPMAYVMPRSNGHYLIEAFGMQHSDPRSAKQKADGEARSAQQKADGDARVAYHDIREDLPEGLRKTFDLRAPALGLSLTAALLRKAGAEKITLPGNEMQWWRKGTKRPQSLVDLKQKLDLKKVQLPGKPKVGPDEYEYPPEVREGIRKIIQNWDKMRGPDVRNALRELRGLTDKSRAFANAHGIPKVILDRNYRQVPMSLGAREITATEAIGDSPLMYLTFNWGVPEPEKVLPHGAYDVNIPKLEHLYPFLAPMTRKEVTEWKKRMKVQGILVDKITGEDSSPT